jgi:hypothetical protein
MHIKLALITGAVLVLTAGTGAAYAVVGHTSVNPTVSGNVLPIDDNHSSTPRPEAGDDRLRATAEPGDDRAHATTEPGDDRSTATAEPGDDRGRATAEPGDDRGRATAEPGDDRSRATAEPGDDRNRGSGTDDATAASRRTTGSLTASPATAATPTTPDDHGRGHDGAGHH